MPNMPIPDQLAPTVINAVVSELKVKNTQLQNIFGGPVVGRNTQDKGGRLFAWDVFNPTRIVADARMPGEPHGKRKPQKVGTVSGRFPRIADSIQLRYEEIHNQRIIGGPVSNIDKMGTDYITRQETYLKQTYANHVEMQIAGMLRGQIYLSNDGDRLVPSLTSGDETIDFRIPAANKLVGASFAAGLDPLGSGTNILTAAWSSASTDIPGDLYQIDEAMTVLTGGRLRHVVCGTAVWLSVLKNNEVRNLAGTSVQPFDYVTQNEDLGQDSFTAVLRGIPWVMWHVCNEVLNFGTTETPATATKLIPNGYCSFIPEVDGSWFEYWNGSEVVVPWVGMPPFEAFGMYFYAVPTAQPAGYELLGVHNGLPALLNPNALMFARVQDD